jgi:hypothetical protein
MKFARELFLDALCDSGLLGSLSKTTISIPGIQVFDCLVKGKRNSESVNTVTNLIVTNGLPAPSADSQAGGTAGGGLSQPQWPGLAVRQAAGPGAGT